MKVIILIFLLHFSSSSGFRFNFRYVTIFSAFVTLHLLWLSGLTMQHMAFIAINITTNEQMNRESKYGYLRDPNTGRFRNPFRRSCKLNCQVCLLCHALVWCAFS